MLVDFLYRLSTWIRSIYFRLTSFYHHHLRKHESYQFGILICAITVGIVTFINAAFTAWAVSKSGIHEDLGTLADGSCSRTRTLTFWIHVVINMVSTILIGPSNYTMQCLSSPTWSEIEKAHSQGIWLDIGVPSFRNLKRLSSTRIALWWMLALSSIPLHLLYNSAVFSTLSTQQYDVFVVSRDFVHGAPFELQYYESAAGNLEIIDPDHSKIPEDSLENLQRNHTTLLQLDNQECIREYLSSINSANADVVLVTTTANSTNSVLSWHQGVKSALVSNDPGLWINIWMCVDDLHYNSTCLDVYDDFEWVCPNYRKGNCTISPSANGSDWSTSVPSRDNGGGAERAVIQYCLSQPVQEHCKLQFSLAIMVVVVLCNLVKAVCMGFIVWRKDPEPLVTLGDALSSF